MQAAGCTIAKEATPSAPGKKYTALLVCLAQPEDPWRVLIEAKDDILLKSGHFMGRAGHGSFVVWKNIEALLDGMSNAWVYNRCSEYKKDIAVRANGMWVLASGIWRAGLWRHGQTDVMAVFAGVEPFGKTARGGGGLRRAQDCPVQNMYLFGII